jgi:hypothetical protein
MFVVALVGALTAIFAASIGLVQNDIKRVLAYSTVSQLGYMFLACGVGAFTAGVFHLMTHAFFKALLFLGSGSVIHAMSGEQDMRNMGGLRQRLPWTHRTMLVGCIAIAGVPPLAGFFSKDEILWSAYKIGGYGQVVWIMGFVVAAMTAFYMFRLYHMTFSGAFRGTAEQLKHLHESPPSMTVPLQVLAVGSLLAGSLASRPCSARPCICPSRTCSSTGSSRSSSLRTTRCARCSRSPCPDTASSGADGGERRHRPGGHRAGLLFLPAAPGVPEARGRESRRPLSVAGQQVLRRRAVRRALRARRRSGRRLGSACHRPLRGGRRATGRCGQGWG